MAQRVGVVLAGGPGRRVGRPKGELPYRSGTLAERAAGILWPLCGSVLISIADGAVNPAPRYPTLVDPAPAGRGPLVGIDAAFDATGDADLLVLACDYPHVTRELMQRLLAHTSPGDDVVMMTDFAGRDHPLVGLWNRSAAPHVRQAVDERRFKVRALLAELAVRRLGPAEFQGTDLDRALVNVNWPDDVAALGSGG